MASKVLERPVKPSSVADVPGLSRVRDPKLKALLAELYRHQIRDARKARTGCG